MLTPKSLPRLASDLINGFFYLVCAWGNRRPIEELDPRLVLKPFVPNKKMPPPCDGSPSRELSNLFWDGLPWVAIKAALGTIHVLDTGCGSGVYGDFLDACSGGAVKRYVGLDVYEHPSWVTSRSQNRDFHRFDGRSITPHIPPDTNFFMSQSAVEHFRDDQRYFRDIKQFIDTNQRPTLQVHLFPSAACMRLYGRHGYRQYTPRTVSRITRLFPDAQCTLFALGGPTCNRVHEAFITRPLREEGVDYRDTKLDEYQQALASAIAQDAHNPSAINDPSFWALVICSRWSNPFPV